MLTPHDTNEWFDHHLSAVPVMIILRNYTSEQCVSLAHQAWDIGIDLVEVPIHVPEAVPALEATIAAGRARGKLVGAGTVISAAQVRTAHELGAAFTVAPGLDLAVLDDSHAHDMPHLPAVATPSEIQRAFTHGVRWLKAFPATALGVSWFTAMRGPFPQVSLLATGGLTAPTAHEFLSAGARAVSLGSSLTDPDQLTQLDALLHREL